MKKDPAYLKDLERFGFVNPSPRFGYQFFDQRFP